MRLPTLDTVWVTLPLVGVLVAASVEPLPPYDFWWHLVMGRMLDAGTFPAANYFLYTMPADAPFHDQPWLAQWLMFKVHDLTGLVGGMVFRSAMLLAAWGLLTWGLVRRAGPKLGGALALAVAVVSYPVLTYRTRLFAFIPFVALILLLTSERRTKWGVVAIGVLSTFWANVHGTFILAPLLTFGSAGAFVLEKLLAGEVRDVERRTFAWWGSAVVVSTIGVLVSPHGFDNLGYVANLAVTSNVSATVSEWLPPDLSTGMGLVWGVAFVASLLVLAWRRRHVPMVEAGLMLATTYLAASAIRSVFWWAVVAAIVVAPHVRELAKMVTDETDDEDGGNLLNLAIILGLVGALVAVHPGTAPQAVREAVGGGRYLNGAHGVLSHENAIGEVRTALEHADGQVFHDQALGGLIAWEATAANEPRQVAFVDQRMELIPESVWDEFFWLSGGREWRAAFERYAIDAAVLAPESQWPLISELEDAPDWQLLRVGQAHLVYGRVGSLDRAQDPAEEPGGEGEEDDVDTAEDL